MIRRTFGKSCWSYGLMAVMSAIIVLLVLLVSGCGIQSSPAAVSVSQGDETGGLSLTSPVFTPGERIPTKYTCQGEDISPPLEWSDPPASTQSFALIVDDPDAPLTTWTHWVLFNLPADTRRLPEQAALPPGSQSGQNSWQRTGYGGPCPPFGTHRYVFKLYALDTLLKPDAGADVKGLLQAMEGHVLAKAELIGTYSKQ